MSRGPEQELSHQLTAALNTWLDTNIAGLDAVRVYRVEQLKQFVDASQASKVFLFAGSNEIETGGRAPAGTDLFEVVVSCVVVAKLDDLELATCDAWDLKTNQIREWFVSQDVVTANSLRFIRRRTTRPVLYDVEALDERELWFSLIETVYRL